MSGGLLQVRFATSRTSCEWALTTTGLDASGEWFFGGGAMGNEMQFVSFRCHGTFSMVTVTTMAMAMAMAKAETHEVLAGCRV